MPSVTRQSKTSTEVRSPKKVSRTRTSVKTATTKSQGHSESVTRKAVSTKTTKKRETQNPSRVLKEAVISTPRRETKNVVSKKMTTPSPKLTRLVKRGSKKVVKRMLLSPAFHSFVRYSTFMMIGLFVVYGVYHFASTTFANEVVVSKSEIISRVAKHQVLPSLSPTDIVRVQDPEDLKRQNPFYNNIKEGDYILMYPSMAIIYDLRNDVIVGVKELKEPENNLQETTF